MNFNHKLVKATAAAALAITGIATVNTVKSQSATAHVQAATMRVKINYVPGYGINIWTNFNHGHFTGQRAKHGTTWNVLATQKDSKGNTWYEIGQNQWIMAKYTVSADKQVRKSTTSAAAKVVKSAAKSTKTVATAKATTKKSSKQASGNAASVLALALSEKGKKYVWGATGPSSFDCSGLVQYVYKHAAGISLPRTTYTQVHAGRAVSLKSLQPGDLLFWGSASAPYHVGIYLGNGQYIHASTPQTGVIVQSLSSYFYPSCARRVLN